MRFFKNSEAANDRKRYLHFAGETGLRVSRVRMALPYCLTRRQADLRIPRPWGFDHTTYWRLEGERLCSVVLTEPYPCSGSLMGSEDWPAFAAKHGLLFATGDANLSLWFPGKTVPIIWYRKDAKNKPGITTVLRYFNANIVEAAS